MYMIIFPQRTKTKPFENYDKFYFYKYLAVFFIQKYTVKPP